MARSRSRSRKPAARRSRSLTRKIKKMSSSQKKAAVRRGVSKGRKQAVRKTKGPQCIVTAAGSCRYYHKGKYYTYAQMIKMGFTPADLMKAKRSARRNAIGKGLRVRRRSKSRGRKRSKSRKSRKSKSKRRKSRSKSRKSRKSKSKRRKSRSKSRKSKRASSKRRRSKSRSRSRKSKSRRRRSRSRSGKKRRLPKALQLWNQAVKEARKAGEIPTAKKGTFKALPTKGSGPYKKICKRYKAKMAKAGLKVKSSACKRG